MLFLIIVLFVVGIVFPCSDSLAAKKKYKYVWKTVTTKKYLGKYIITHYCPCRRCCGKDNGITSTGKKAKAGRTIAVDPKQIPYGSKVKIGKKTYIAEDTGSAMRGVKKIDIFCKSHSEALQKGLKYEKVWLIKKKKKKVKVRIK